MTAHREALTQRSQKYYYYYTIIDALTSLTQLLIYKNYSQMCWRLENLHTYRSRRVTNKNKSKTPKFVYPSMAKKKKLRKICTILYNWETADENMLGWHHALNNDLFLRISNFNVRMSGLFRKAIFHINWMYLVFVSKLTKRKPILLALN